MPKPFALRRLRADMVLKELNVRDIARLTRIPYVTVSLLLNGRLVDPARLSKIHAAVVKARDLNHA